MKTDQELMQQALEALELHAKQYPHMQKGYTVDAITALRERLAQPVHEPVDNAEKASTYLDARLWEFIDMAAAWPEAKPDPSTWEHVLVYAPKQPEKPRSLIMVQQADRELLQQVLSAIKNLSDLFDRTRDWDCLPIELVVARAAEKALCAALEQHTEMDEAIAADDGTLHGAIDYWQEREH